MKKTRKKRPFFDIFGQFLTLFLTCFWSFLSISGKHLRVSTFGHMTVFLMEKGTQKVTFFGHFSSFFDVFWSFLGSFLEGLDPYQALFSKNTKK
jgi:hypothetical protein